MANTQTSVPVFTAGQVLTAAQQNLINTGIPVFADSSARDAAFGGTGEKTLAEGQFAFLEDTNATQYYDGSTWEAVASASGLVLIKSQTIGSAVTTVALTNIFSATYENYRIILSGGTASATSDGSFILGATTANYYNAFQYNGFVSPFSGTFTGGSNTANSGSVVLYSANGINSVIDIFSPFSTARTGYNFTGVQIATTGNRVQGSGFQDSATSFTGMTFSTQGGHTWTGGTIKVYGYQNS